MKPCKEGLPVNIFKSVEGIFDMFCPSEGIADFLIFFTRQTGTPALMLCESLMFQFRSSVCWLSAIKTFRGTKGNRSLF